MMKLFKTMVIFFLVGFSVLVLTPIAVLAAILSLAGLEKPMSVMMYRIAQGWALAVIRLSGSQVTVEGRNNIPQTGGVCFVSNHGSIFDIVLNLAYIGRPFGFVAKKELLLIPLLNAWISILGGLFIDRKHPRKGLETITKGVARIKNGGGILIFPEGHRSRGAGLLPFRPGSFKLATQSGAALVPVAISGSYDVFERNHRINAAAVRIVFGKPILQTDLPPENRKQFLADEARRVIQAALDTTPAIRATENPA